MLNLIWSGLLAVLLLSGCGWDGVPTRHNVFTPLTSIEISAVSSNIAAHTSVKLSAKGNYSGLFTRDITDQVVWSNASPTVADFVTATDRARVTGLIPGTALLTAKVGSVSATFKLTVSPATINTLAITPAAPSIAKGLSTQLSVIGTFSDTTTQDLTFDSSWASSAVGVATVSDAAAGKGLAIAVAVGTSTISATFDSISGSTVMTVTEPVLQTITLSPANPSILTLSTKKITASGTYSDGSTADLTSQVAWNSSNTAIATIAADGTASALTQGATTISASLGSISSTTNLKATGGNLNGITVSPAAVTLVKDISSRISATGTFSNGSTRDITGAVQWTVANASLASVTASGGNLALVNPLAVTLVPVTFTATSGSQTANASLTVIERQLSSIALSTTILDLTAGTSSPIAVTATFSDNTSQNVTTLSVWTSNDDTKATVAAGGLGTERVTGVAAGSTTISAAYGGKTVPTPATVTVRSRTLQSLAISGSSAITVGNRVSFTALASYGDGTTIDVTENTAWSIDTVNVAILADSVNQSGQVVGVDSGSATLTAVFGGKTQTAKITVAGP